MLEAIQSALELFNFSALASDVFGRPIGAVAAAILILGTIATGCGVLAGLYYARKRYVIAHQELTLKEEALNKPLPKAEFLLFGEKDVDSILYMVPFDGKTLFALPLNIGIKNNSKTEFKNLLVLMKLNADVYGLDFISREPGPMAQAFGFERYEQGEDGTKLVVVLTKVKRVPPESTSEIEDTLFTSSSTVIEEVVEAESRDGVLLQIPFTLETALDVKMNIQGENVGSNAKKISVHFLKRPEGSIKDHFQSKYGGGNDPDKQGKTVIVWFDGAEENQEYSEMMKGLNRDLGMYRKDKKAGLKKMRKKYGSKITEAELSDIIEGKNVSSRESLVVLTGKTVAVMNRRYP